MKLKAVASLAWKRAKENVHHALGIAGLAGVAWGLAGWLGWPAGVTTFALPFALFWVWGESIRVRSTMTRE